jgi:hypothetical protein
MRSLCEYEITAVSGGDRWCYENSDGGVDEDRSSSYAASYQTGSNGILGGVGGSSWGNYVPPPVSVSCIAGAVGAAGAVGGAIASPEPNSIARAIGAVGAWWGACAEEFGGSYLKAGGYSGWVGP